MTALNKFSFLGFFTQSYLACNKTRLGPGSDLIISHDLSSFVFMVITEKLLSDECADTA